MNEWVIRDEPALAIGSDSAGTVNGTRFSGVIAALRHDDGRVIVADADQTRLFAANGESLGQLGEGGSERIQRLPGDSLFIVWRTTGQAALLDPAGATVKSWSPIYRLRWLGRLGDGVLVSRRSEPGETPPGAAGVLTMSTTVVSHDAEGGITGDLGRFAGDEVLLTSDGAHVGDLLGQLKTLVSTEHVYVAASRFLDVQKILVSDGSVRRISIDTDPVPLPARLEHSSWGSLAAVLNEMPPESRPASFPAIGRLLADDAGNIWIEEFPTDPTSTIRWWVFGADEELKATVRMPPGFHAFDVGRDYVLGVTRDSLHGERVTLHALLK